ncbi:histidine phosphatase family protein [Rhodococcus sp. UNC363MFTsu5.1]|uniref:histidine phosphatase family protein n=1 Tax=Rhodococcus sp. UNC363MFTsu5.1 TaxID=1449069 RepID=UPI000483E25D|nr:histidine phosphatase family protein [Rhodococcus sp. UNC363MFTsu5.1]
MAKDEVTRATTIMLIRHAERPEGDEPPFGVDRDGTRCDESLTPTGWQRATALAALFAPDAGEPPAGLVRPEALFASTPSKKDGSKRSLQTISPLADKLGVEVDTDIGRSEVKALAKRVLRTPGPVLISWQREYLPEIVDALGEIDSTPPDPWPEDRFDVIWLLTPDGTRGWVFSQLPQRLLPGDRATGI